MKMPKRLLLAVTAMAALGFVRADFVAPIQNADTAVAAESDSNTALSRSMPYSFADIVNLPSASGQRLPTGNAFSRVPDATLAELSNVTEPAQPWPGGANAGASPPRAAYVLSGTIDNLSSVIVPDEFSTSGFEPAGLRAGAGYLFSTAEMPEPAGWMTLICGLVVIAFMARRKGGPFAG